MTIPIVLKPKGFWHALLTEQGYAQKTMLVGIHCFILRAGSTALCRDDEDPKG